MFNFFKWKIKKFEEKIYLTNWNFWFEVIYNWNQKEWTYFLYPYFEQNLHTYIYFCFDKINQKLLFEKLIKLPGIWPKTAYIISMIDENIPKKATEDFDINFFKNLPGIWPKTAKRILVELKDSFNKIEFNKLQIDEELFKKITTTLSNLGYDKNQVKSLLKECEIPLKEENIEKIIKRLLDNLK
jgi:Holliday junction DNA helicase RuvA